MPHIERVRGVCPYVCLLGWHEGKSRKEHFRKKFFGKKVCRKPASNMARFYTNRLSPFASLREIFQASSPARKMTKLNFRKRGFSVLRAEEGKMPPLRSFARQRWHHQLLNPLTLPRVSPSTFDLTKKSLKKFQLRMLHSYIPSYLKPNCSPRSIKVTFSSTIPRKSKSTKSTTTSSKSVKSSFWRHFHNCSAFQCQINILIAFENGFDTLTAFQTAYYVRAKCLAQITNLASDFLSQQPQRNLPQFSNRFLKRRSGVHRNPLKIPSFCGNSPSPLRKAEAIYHIRTSREHTGALKTLFFLSLPFTACFCRLLHLLLSL